MLVQIESEILMNKENAKPKRTHQKRRNKNEWEVSVKDKEGN